MFGVFLGKPPRKPHNPKPQTPPPKTNGRVRSGARVGKLRRLYPSSVGGLRVGRYELTVVERALLYLARCPRFFAPCKLCCAGPTFRL